MRKLLKLASFSALILMLVLGGGMYFGLRWVQQSAGAATLSSFASERLGRPVQVEGVRVLSPRSVSFQVVTLSHPKEAPTPEISFQDLTVELDWAASWALRKPVFHQVSCRAGLVKLLASDLSKNKGVKLSPGSSSPSSGKRPTLPTIAGLASPSSQLPPPREEKLALSPDDLPVLLRELHLSKISIVSEKIELAHLQRLDLTLHPDLSGELTSRGVFGQSGGFHLTGSGRNLLSSAPSGEAELQGTGLPVILLGKLASQFTSLPGELVAGDLDLTAKVTVREGVPDASLMLLPHGVEVRSKLLPGELHLSGGRLQFTRHALEVDLEVGLGGLKGRMDGDWLPPRPEGKLKMDLKMAPFGFRELAPFFPDKIRERLRGRSRGSVTAEVSLRGSVQAPSWSFHIKPRGLVLESPGVPPLKLSGKGLQGTPAQAQLDLSLEAQGLSLEAQGELAPLSKEGLLHFEIEGRGLPLESLVSLARVSPEVLKTPQGKVDLFARYQGTIPEGVAQVVRNLEARLQSHEIRFQLPRLGGQTMTFSSRKIQLQKGLLTGEGLRLGSNLGSLEVDLQGHPLKPEDPLEGTLRLHDMHLLQLLPGPIPKLLDPNRSTLSGTLTGSLSHQAGDWSLALKPSALRVSLGLGKGMQELRLKVLGGDLTPGYLSLKGLKLSGLGLATQGDLAVHTAPLKLDTQLAFELRPGDLPSFLLPEGVKMSGALLGALSHRGTLEELKNKTLTLTPKDFRVKTPSLPKVLTLHSGTLHISAKEVGFQAVDLKFGEEFRARLKGKVSRERLKATMEFPETSLEAMISLVPKNLIPSQISPLGKVSGRVFFGGPLDLSPASLAKAVAIRLRPRAAGIRVRRPGTPPMDLLLGKQDIVLKGGKISLNGVKVRTPMGEILLSGSVQPLGSAPWSLAFSAPKLQNFARILPQGASSEGFLVLDGRIKGIEGGVDCKLRLRPRGFGIHQGTQHLGLPSGALRLALRKQGEQLRFQIQPEDLALQFASMVQPLRWSGGSVHFQGETLTLRDLTLKLGKGTELYVEGGVQDLFQKGRFEGASLRGKIRLGDLQPTFGLTSSRDLVGEVQVSSTVTGRLGDFLVAGDFLALRGVTVVFHSTTGGQDFPIPLEKLRVPFHFQGHELKLQGVEAQLYGGKVNSSMNFWFQAAPFKFYQHWKLEGIDLGQFVRRSARMPGGLQGKLSLTMGVNGQGAETTNLQMTGSDGRVAGFVIEAGVLGKYFSLDKYLHPGKSVASKKQGWKQQLLGILTEAVVENVDALADLREHLKTLLHDHAYPDLAFKVGAPMGSFGLERFWIPGQPGRFEGNMRVRLDTLDLNARIDKMDWKGERECRYFLSDLNFSGKANAPSLKDKMFWKHIKKSCPQADSAVPAPAVPAPTPVSAPAPASVFGGSSLVPGAVPVPPVVQPATPAPPPAAPSWGTR
jgi:hypothetical protein